MHTAIASELQSMKGLLWEGEFGDSCEALIMAHKKGGLSDFLNQRPIERYKYPCDTHPSLWGAIAAGYSKPRIIAFLLSIADKTYIDLTLKHYKEAQVIPGDTDEQYIRLFALVKGYLEREFRLTEPDEVFGEGFETHSIYEEKFILHTKQVYQKAKSLAEAYHQYEKIGDAQPIESKPLLAAESYYDAAEVVVLKLLPCASITELVSKSIGLYCQELLVRRNLAVDGVEVETLTEAEKQCYSPPGPLFKACQGLNAYLKGRAYSVDALFAVMPLLERLAYLIAKFNLQMPQLCAKYRKKYQASYFLPYYIWPMRNVDLDKRDYADTAKTNIQLAIELLDAYGNEMTPPSTVHALRLYVPALVESALYDYACYLAEVATQPLPKEMRCQLPLVDLLQKVSKTDCKLSFLYLKSALIQALPKNYHKEQLDFDPNLSDPTAMDEIIKKIKELHIKVRNIAVLFRNTLADHPDLLPEPPSRRASGGSAATVNSGSVASTQTVIYAGAGEDEPASNTSKESSGHFY